MDLIASRNNMYKILIVIFSKRTEKWKREDANVEIF